ncbi:hypothetical protein B0H14DRAFT_2806081 [Mycena olivaceomarginata]|nr:hypothetical protein B0H14DRAFT_2806081 [Mycena olivaceomarginata]
MTERCYPSAPALFIQSSDSSSVSELSPLDEGPFSDYRYSPSTSGRSSPIDAWSPVSSFSGDIFPDDLPEDFWSHQQELSSHPSPSPSLSPITSALDNFKLDERYPPADQSVLLNGPPIGSRLRSSSHSVQAVSPPEVWVDGVGRGRSASFTASTTDNQFYRNDGPIQHGNFPQYGYTSNSEVQSLGGGNTNPAHPGQLVSGWTYPSSESSSDVSQERPPLSPSLLTVPPVGLQRRPACSSRVRSRSASDLTSLFPPGQDPGRGRGQHRTTLSIPNSRSVSNGSRVSSRDVSPHSLVCFSDVQTPASFSPSSSSSSAFEDAELGGNGVGRRRTFTANRGPDDRASSVPSKGRRSKVPSSRAGQGVFKAVKTEASTMAFLSPEGSDGSQQEFRVAQPAVASKKIRMASDKRRINAAIFKCTYPDCSSTFTARHNLTNHLNSHQKIRPYSCKRCRTEKKSMDPLYSVHYS